MVFVTNSAGRATFVERTWTRLTGQTLAAARDMGWVAVLHPDDRVIVRDLVLRAIREERGFTVRYRIRRIDGQFLWVAAGAVPSFGPPDRTFLGFLGSIMPLDDAPPDIARATGSLGTIESAERPGSALERAADHLLAAHTLIASSGSAATLLALEATLHRLGQDLAEQTLREPAEPTTLQ